jgi:hypothetical protein
MPESTASVSRRYNTDVADTEQLLRLIQSVPLPKAEPFKMQQHGKARLSVLLG